MIPLLAAAIITTSVSNVTTGSVVHASAGGNGSSYAASSVTNVINGDSTSVHVENDENGHTTSYAAEESGDGTVDVSTTTPDAHIEVHASVSAGDSKTMPLPPPLPITPPKRVPAPTWNQRISAWFLSMFKIFGW
jgi:hypothetical protein